MPNGCQQRAGIAFGGTYGKGKGVGTTQKTFDMRSFEAFIGMDGMR